MGQKQQIIRQADQCVKCGICLPHCPTYRITGMEGYSPRGRIALMQGLAAGDLHADDKTAKYLDTCLGCRFCETACPSRVQYSELWMQARALMRDKSHEKTEQPVKSMFFLQRRSMLWLFRGLWLAQRSGLLAFSSRLPSLKGGRPQILRNMMPRLLFPRRLRAFYRCSSDNKKGRVALFTGCTGETLGRGTLLAGVRCLNRLGYDVDVPAAQQCCGLALRHHGCAVDAEAMAAKNIQAFSEETSGNRRILVFASGCQMALQEYSRHPGRETAQVKPFIDSIDSVERFLRVYHAKELQTMAVRQQRSACKVFVHSPCTQQYLKESGMATLFEILPGVEVISASLGQCCGAAGSHFLTHPQQSGTLAKGLLEEFEDSQAYIFLTSNIGCELHLRAQLKLLAIKAKVMHPIQFLVERI